MADVLQKRKKVKINKIFLFEPIGDENVAS